MLELNAWFFVLLLNFLVLLYVLNAILFKPLAKLFGDRDDSIKGSLASAKEMHSQREELQAKVNRELQEARNTSKEIFDGMRKEGLSRQKEMLGAAGKQAHDIIEKARGELKTEAGMARQKLRSDVEKFSDDIVRKLVGA